MKSNLLIIALSGLGLALLTGIVLLSRIPSPTPGPIVASVPLVVTNRTQRNVPPPAEAVATSSFRWSSLESTDYKQYIANLRAIGCPEDTIREIIVADINKLYAPREAPFKTKLTAQPTAAALGSSARRAARQAEFAQRSRLHEIQKEKNALLKQLLGITLPLEPLRAAGIRNYALFETAFNALPSEKREAVREVQENYWLAADALGDKYNGKRTPPYLAEYKRLNEERNAQLARLLPPQELEQYEMRTSNAGVALRESLQGFNPSEEEYRAIWRAQRDGEELNLAAVDPQRNEAAKLSNSDRQELVGVRIKAALGEQRYAEYERSQDPTYRSLVQLAERYELSPEAVRKGYAVHTSYREQQEKVRDNSELSPQQRKEALAALKAEADRSMAEAFGETAARTFEHYGIHDFHVDDDEE